MIDIDTAIGWRGHELIDRDGDKIGTVEEIYLDQETGQPEWATVKTGLIGTKHAFVPIGRATAEGEIVRIPFEKEQVKDAPSIEADGPISQDEEAELYRHYGLEYTKAGSGTGLGEDHPASPGGSPASGSTASAVEGEEGGGDAGDRDRDAGFGDENGRPSAETDPSTPSVTGAQAQAGAAWTSGDGDRETGHVDREARGDAREQERVRLKRYVVTDEVTRTVTVDEQPASERTDT